MVKKQKQSDMPMEYTQQVVPTQAFLAMINAIVTIESCSNTFCFSEKSEQNQRPQQWLQRETDQRKRPIAREEDQSVVSSVS